MKQIQLCSCGEAGSWVHGFLSPASDASPRTMQHTLLRTNEETRLKPFINTFEPLVNKSISNSLFFYCFDCCMWWLWSLACWTILCSARTFNICLKRLSSKLHIKQCIDCIVRSNEKKQGVIAPWCSVCNSTPRGKHCESWGCYGWEFLRQWLFFVLLSPWLKLVSATKLYISLYKIKAH